MTNQPDSIQKKKLSLKGLWQVLKESFEGFGNDQVPKLSGSLAYYTIFSMGPLLIVIIYLCSVFFGREAIEGSIYNQIQSFVGEDTARQMEQIIKNAYLDNKNSFAAIIGIITLLIGATTVFADIQGSINTIWQLKPKPQKGIWRLIKTRLLSFSVIVSLGFILLVSLAITGLIEGLSGRLQNAFPDVAVAIFYAVNLLISLIVTTILFSLIFKVLPDAHIRWKDVMAGALTTAVLFMVGKFAISLYISKSNIGSTYGTAGSLVILLLWVYYSAFILYFGAEFTRAYALKFGEEIKPNEFSVSTKVIEIETEEEVVQNKNQQS